MHTGIEFAFARREGAALQAVMAEAGETGQSALHAVMHAAWERDSAGNHVEADDAQIFSRTRRRLGGLPKRRATLRARRAMTMAEARLRLVTQAGCRAKRAIPQRWCRIFSRPGMQCQGSHATLTPTSTTPTSWLHLHRPLGDDVGDAPRQFALRSVIVHLMRLGMPHASPGL